MNIDKLKKIIYEANPEIKVRNTSALIPKPFSGIINYRDETIRLADVLLALEEKDKQLEKNVKEKYPNQKNVKSMGFIIQGTEMIKLNLWNLKNDNLDNQSDETKQFLINLLVH